ncbi:GFA family protein [Chloroflexi bacterium TSY]|nr:GFA family protein [Chloroflexi bacterium TSY]
MTNQKANDLVLKGSCTCGGIQFEIRGPFVGIGQCHCSKCRKETGTGSSTFMPVHGEQFTWISGENLVNDYDRCQACGSLAPDHNPRRDLYNIPAGLLDDDTGIQIVDHIFVGSKANWDIIGDSAPQHEEDGPPLI